MKRKKTASILKKFLLFNFFAFLVLGLFTTLYLIAIQPSLVKKLTRSLISGSIAQFDNIVFPLAKDAAIIRFSVAPTEIFGNLILAPIKPFGALA